MKKYRLLSGFTLIELMVTLVIAVILISLTAPSFTALINGSTLKYERDTLVAHIRLARAEAMKRKISPVLCKSNDGVGCGGNAVNWEDGWVLFIDDGAGGGGVANDNIVNGNEYVMALQTALSANTTIVETPADYGAIPYMASGFLNPGAVIFPVTFQFCHTTLNNTDRRVVLNAVGRPRATDGDATGC
ncbi:MAG: type IV fimbrial biogenesis protein FimT [Pseudohongiellaceae bacterium]|jgi:type IV fimbrial biogenesis protein FimT